MAQPSALAGNRKFILAAFASVSAGVLCYLGKITGGDWVAVQGLVLGLFGAANVIDKKLGGAG
jgi:hypothetical protein